MAHKRSILEVLPEVTWDKIAPPYPDYPYFQGMDDYPFRPRADGFDPVNAWWCIEASTLAYAAEDFARARFQQAGFTAIAYFSGNSTQCFVAHNDDFLLLVFRGTEIRRRQGRSDFANIFADLETNANIALVESGHGGKVHRGFQAVLDEVWEQAGLLDYLRSQEKARRTVWFTGHSLGAALATVAAQRYDRVRGLYTFGSPRVGDGSFKEALAVPTYRVVNHDDIVTRVPPPLLYRHVGDLHYIDGEGLLHHHPAGVEPGKVLSVLAACLDALIPSGLVDHVPTLYATHIWNNLP
jgi:triacylglycerol lipase